MINLIAAANGKLDDPIMKEWAVQFYSDLPKHAHDERIRIEADWFHEFFIAQLIDRRETGLLTRLFRVLPPQHLSNLKTFFLKNWSVWPRSLVDSAAKVLAIIDPEELLQLFEHDLIRLKQGSFDPLRFLSIDQLRTNSNDVACAVIVNQLSKLVIDECPDDYRKSMLILSLLKVSQRLAWDMLESLIDIALRMEHGEGRRKIIFESLFTGLFGHNEFLVMIFDREQFEFESSLQLTSLQPFFVSSAPLGKLERWLQELPQLKETLEILENLSEESSGCKILLGLLRDSNSVAGRLSSKVQVQLSIAACLHGFATPSLDTSKLDLMATVNLLAADLANPQRSKQLMDHLSSFDQSSVITALTSRLLEDLDSYGTIHIAQAMGELGYSAFVEPLIVALGADQGDFLCEAARKSLTEIGSSAQAALIEQWDRLDSSQRIYGLSVINSVHGKAVADFAVARFFDLLAEDIEFGCELILASPDSRLLDLLKPELRRKQPQIDRAFYICARLLDYAGPEIQGAKERALAEFERCENLYESMETGSLPIQDQLILDLECPLCKAVNRYEAKGVIISDDPDAAFLLNDEFPCASCGQDVEFGFTPMAKMMLSAKFLGSQINVKAGRQQNDQFKTIDYKVDGHVMPLSTGLATIRKHLAAKPDDGREWFRLGNLLSFLNRPKETIAAYRKALSNEPNAVDAKFALASFLTDYQQEGEAWVLLQKALERMSSWIFLLPYPNFSNEFTDLYNHLRRISGRNELPALHPSALAVSKKIGRNDSCPCGSGKKFKKCCGR